MRIDLTISNDIVKFPHSSNILQNFSEISNETVAESHNVVQEPENDITRSVSH